MLASIISNIHYHFIKPKKTIKSIILPLSLLQQTIWIIDKRIKKLENPRDTCAINIMTEPDKIIKSTIKYHTPMNQLLDNDEYFIIYNKSIVNNLTPKTIELENDDTVEIRKKPEECMDIIIQQLTGRQTSVGIESSTTIEDLKYVISEKIGVPSDQQRLIFSGRQLENHRTVSDYNIQRDNKLQLVLRLRGGMFHTSSAKIDYEDFNNMITKRNVLDEIQKDVDNKKSNELKYIKKQILIIAQKLL